MSESANKRGSSWERRREVHLALAEASDDPEQRARHLAITTESPDPELVALLESAAASARARGAPATVADLLERARQLTPENDAATKGKAEPSLMNREMTDARRLRRRET